LLLSQTYVVKEDLCFLVKLIWSMKDFAS
jgi:hypothetical protein